MHPFVHRRLPEPRPTPPPQRKPPQPLAVVIQFPLRPFRERDLTAEVLEAFREAKYGKT